MSLSKNTKMFISYVFPSMIGMLVIGSYSIVDTIFIGRAAGEVGLAAVAITWPIIFLFGAVADMLGTGASIIISHARGGGNIQRARKALGAMIALQVIMGVGLMALLYLFLGDILRILGATDEFIGLSMQYGKIMTLFCLPGMLAMALTSVIRNDGRPVLAMWATILGLGMNIILDYIFIFPLGYGVVGAAYATILAQVIGAAAVVGYFLTQHTKLRLGADMFRVRRTDARDIIVFGVPALGNQLSIIAMLLLHNYQSMKYGNVPGLAAYTFVGAVESVGALLMTGLSLGVMPLAAYLHGARRHVRQNIVGNMGYMTALVLGIVMMLVSFAGHNIFPAWFNLHGAGAQLAGHALVISSLAFPLLGVIRVAGYYYQATGKVRAASMLIYGDAFFALPLCLFILPPIFGLDGVWMAMPVSRLVLLGLTLWLWFGRGKRGKQISTLRRRARAIMTK